MKRAFLIACGLLALGLTANWLRLALMSEETRIRRLLEGMADGFNRTRAGDCVEGLADDFYEETGRIGRDEVLNYVRYLFLSRRDRETRRFLYRAELPEERLNIKLLAEDKRQAAVDLVARFFKLQGESQELIWEARITADLEKGEDGWRVKRSRHKTLRGKRRL